MAKIRFFYDNNWISPAISSSSAHPNFPASNAQIPWLTRSWRSRYEAGSGWGNFTIILGTNDALDFDEGGAEINITVPTGSYTADTLALQVGTLMTAASVAGWTFVCTYSDDTNLFTIEETSGPNNFTIRWLNGTNTATNVADTMGYDNAADDNGLNASFESDNVRIHNVEWVTISSAVVIPMTSVIIKHHNFSATVFVQIQGSNDNFATTLFNDTFVYNADIMALMYTVTRSYRYWRIWIEDTANDDGYVEMGIVFLGPDFSPLRNFSPIHLDNPQDPSLLKYSEGGQISTIQREHFLNKNYTFKATNEKTGFDAIFDEVGISKALFICDDPDVGASVTEYFRLTPWSWSHLAGDFWNLLIGVEKLR